MTSNTVVFVSSKMNKCCMLKTVMAFLVLYALSTLYSAKWIYDETSNKRPEVGNDVNKTIRDKSSLVHKPASDFKSIKLRDNILMGKRVYRGDILQNRKNAFDGQTSSGLHGHKDNKTAEHTHNKHIAYTGPNILFGYKKEVVRNNILLKRKSALDINSRKHMWSDRSQHNRDEGRNEKSNLQNGRINMLPSYEHCKINSSERFEQSDSRRIKVGILIPSTTTNMQNPSLYELPLVRISLPSLYKTFEKKYLYKIYIGVDKGDRLENFQDEIQTMFDCVVIVYSFGKNFVKSVNTIAEKAYNDGMDYLVRINDDTKFLTANWTSFGIEKLRGYIPQNIGVVGPTCSYGNVYILTHDMVHRTHLEIFNFYYPPYFENWWADDWITRVYKPDRSSKLKSWTVIHSEGKRRYTVDFTRENWVETLIEFDKIRLLKYLEYS